MLSDIEMSKMLSCKANRDERYTENIREEAKTNIEFQINPGYLME